LPSGKRTDGSALIRVSQSLGSGASSKAAAAVVAASKVSTIMGGDPARRRLVTGKTHDMRGAIWGQAFEHGGSYHGVSRKAMGVARRRGVPLASLDKALRGAGSVLGVPILGEKGL
jgi:hypothetical protein